MAQAPVSGDVLTVWDAAGDPPADHAVVYRWEGHAEHGPVLSLLRYVDVHGERLRRKYLAWIHDLGQSRVAGGGAPARIIDRLRRDDGLSYWWMTSLVEQSLMYKSPGILD